MWLLVLWLVGGGGAQAQEAARWQVVESSGRVAIAAGGAQPVALARGAVLAGGEQIRTGADGRVVLRRGLDTLIVAPDSAILLPVAETSAITRVLQLLGSLVVRAEHRKDGAFEVRTPHLVAVVKGTLFSVTIEPGGGSVHVGEGSVEVHDLARGSRIVVDRGQSVRIATDRPSSLRSATIGAPSPPSLDRVARDVAAGSGGLLAIEGAPSVSGGEASGGAGEASLSRADRPATALLRGLGGNRSRAGGRSPLLPPSGGAGQGQP